MISPEPPHTSRWRPAMRLAAAFFAGSMVLAGCGMGAEQSDEGQRAEAASPGEWRGIYGGTASEGTAVATTQAEWQALWQQMGSEPPAALPVGYVGVGIFLGTRMSGGFGIAMESQGALGGAYMIRYREVGPAPGAMVTMAITAPYVVWTLPDPGTPITIEKVAP